MPSEAARGAREALIVVPPFATVRYPMIGPSLLSAACARRGISCGVFYANAILASRIDFDLYERVADSASTFAVGEQLFAAEAFGVAHADYLLPPDLDRVAVADIAALIGPFIADTVREIVRSAARIVGFSSSFQQNAAVVALARTLKATAPDRIIILGGANADAPMGAALGELVDCFDVIVSGEADDVFPEICRSLLDGGSLPSSRVVRATPIERLDTTAIPEYADYFEAIEPLVDAGKLPRNLPSSLPFESSRGCWWGQRTHCTFCGLNATGMAYRRKSATHVVAEIERIVQTYGVTTLHATDNIMPFEFASDVLPRLAEHEPRLEIFYEVKANVKPDVLDLFVLAGVGSIQPGIESLSGAVLQRIGKGVQAAQNIALLRDCASRQIDVNWNLLVDVPGDEPTEYEEMAAIVHDIGHLQPPSGCTPVLIDRYSPYFAQPQSFGITDVEPLAVYSRIYPSAADLPRLAYHFRGTFASSFGTESGQRLAQEVARWKTEWSKKPGPVLMMIALDSGDVVVLDTRTSRNGEQVVLTARQLDLLRRCESPRNAAVVEAAWPEELRFLRRQRYVVDAGPQVVSVVVEPERGFSLRGTGNSQVGKTATATLLH